MRQRRGDLSARGRGSVSRAVGMAVAMMEPMERRRLLSVAAVSAEQGQPVGNASPVTVTPTKATATKATVAKVATVKATMARGVLKVTGTAGADLITLEAVPADDSGGVARLVIRSAKSPGETVLRSDALSDLKAIRVDAGKGNDHVEVMDAGGLLLGKDVSIAGGAGDDTLVGGLGRERLFGGAGNDSLAGNGGHDDLEGGTGDDALDGGSGDDYLAGGAGNDMILGGEGHDALLGGRGADTLLGDAGRDYLAGNAGNDNLTGGADFDYLFGGAGDDELSVESYEVYVSGGKGRNSVVQVGTGGESVVSASAGGLGEGTNQNGADEKTAAEEAAEKAAEKAIEKAIREMQGWVKGSGDTLSSLNRWRLAMQIAQDEFVYWSVSGSSIDTVDEYVDRSVWGSSIDTVTGPTFVASTQTGETLLAQLVDQLFPKTTSSIQTLYRPSLELRESLAQGVPVTGSGSIGLVSTKPQSDLSSGGSAGSNIDWSHVDVPISAGVIINWSIPPRNLSDYAPAEPVPVGLPLTVTPSFLSILDGATDADWAESAAAIRGELEVPVASAAELRQLLTASGKYGDATVQEVVRNWEDGDVTLYRNSETGSLTPVWAPLMRYFPSTLSPSEKTGWLSSWARTAYRPVSPLPAEPDVADPTSTDPTSTDPISTDPISGESVPPNPMPPQSASPEGGSPPTAEPAPTDSSSDGVSTGASTAGLSTAGLSTADPSMAEQAMAEQAGGPGTTLFSDTPVAG